MHFRIQTVNSDIRAIDMLKQGLKDLESICDHTLESFVNELNKT
jgi:DNA-directed RNA polymerase subunit L